MGDKVRFNQILINLLFNSVKYTQLNGQINFEITDLGTSSSAVENIRFVVSDNGYGISEEFQKVIFAPFTRAESTLVNKKVGSGLGLAILKKTAGLWRGGDRKQRTIDVEKSNMMRYNYAVFLLSCENLDFTQTSSNDEDTQSECFKSTVYG